MPSKRMNIEERYKYLSIQYERYCGASELEKRKLLDEMMLVTEMHRKPLVRMMKQQPQRQRRCKQRSKQYGAKVQDCVRLIARALDYPCRERLKPMLVEIADHLARLKVLRLTQETRDKLESISGSTVGRILGRMQQDEPRLRQHAAPCRRALPLRVLKSGGLLHPCFALLGRGMNPTANRYKAC